MKLTEEILLIKQQICSELRFSPNLAPMQVTELIDHLIQARIQEFKSEMAAAIFPESQR